MIRNNIGFFGVNGYQPKKVIPIHYNTFDAIKQDANAWANLVRKETKAEPIIPAVGEWVMV